MFFTLSHFRASDAPRRPEKPPRPPQDGLRGPQDGTKTAQEGPKTAQKAPQTAQDSPKTAPRGAQEGEHEMTCRALLEESRDCQQAPTRPQEAPKRPPRGSKKPHECLRGAPKKLSKAPLRASRKDPLSTVWAASALPHLRNTYDAQKDTSTESVAMQLCATRSSNSQGTAGDNYAVAVLDSRPDCEARPRNGCVGVVVRVLNLHLFNSPSTPRTGLAPC